jgi:hypothetical protein
VAGTSGSLMNGLIRTSAPGLRARVWIVRQTVVACTSALFVCFGSGALADLVIPSGAVVSLGGGNVDLGCTDATNAGTLNIGAGSLATRNLAILAGGVFGANQGSTTVAGSFFDAGTFNAGTGVVRFVDGCALNSATLTGSTSFYDARFNSATGKNYLFAVGTTQSVAHVLEINGTAPAPIQFRSTAPGQVAFIDLAVAGTQSISHVGVSDVWATGQFLAPGLSNEGGTGNANRWFGTSGPPGPLDVTAIPTLGDAGLILLIVMLGGASLVTLRRRTRSR